MDTKRTTPTTRQPADVLCTICGQPLAECTIGGLHGMVRDRTAAATRQLRAGKSR